jgi:hypothetical protein
MFLPEEMYSLEDIEKALKASGKLQFNGIDMLGCPTKVKGSKIHRLSCDGIPSECEPCQKQKCKQSLDVFNKNGKLCVLSFYFLIYTETGPGKTGGGFISKEDNQLKLLITRKDITV